MHQMTGQIVTSRTLVVLYLGSFLLCEIQESALIQEQELSVMFNANYGRLTEITNQGCIKEEVRLLHSVGVWASLAKIAYQRTRSLARSTPS